MIKVIQWSDWIDMEPIMDLLVFFFSFHSFFCTENGFSVEGKGDALYLKSTPKYLGN